jgi:heptosyltransferase III
MIDLLVNDDTFQLAMLLPNINLIHQFSYLKKQQHWFKQEINLFKSLYKKYDLSISLTASDRSVIYALLAGRSSISVVEKDNQKSWWKKKFLTRYYYYSSDQNILVQNLTPLRILNIDFKYLLNPIYPKEKDITNTKEKLKNMGIIDFVIFHPSAQYEYKVLPRKLRNEIIISLSKLGVKIIVTGGKNEIDIMIKNETPLLNNVINLIGKTSLGEYIALSELSLGYIGMDTLNMHIAAAQNKRIFALFGPTKIAMWAPWSNQIQQSTSINANVQTYGNITIFQSTIPCKVCGEVGCGSVHGSDDFKFKINSEILINKVSNWYLNV